MEMNKISNQFQSIEQVTGQYLGSNKKVTQQQSQGEVSFDQILKQKQTQQLQESSELKFSKHASQRLEDRNINLSSEQLQRLENGTIKASEKGIKESLVLVDSLAFIVNVPNNTVVTAMDQTESGDKIYTNIDGAVII